MTPLSEDLEPRIRAWVDLRERQEITKNGLVEAITILIQSEIQRLADSAPLEPGDRVMTSLGRTGTFVRHGKTHGCVYVLFDGDAEPSSTALRHIVVTEEDGDPS